jgi:thioredoxin reductase
MNVDVLVIGGGLAGLASANEAAKRGLKAAIVEESWSLGGQLRQQTQYIDGLPAPYEGLRGYELVQNLISGCYNMSQSIDTYLQHSVIGAYADGSVGVSNGERIIPIQAQAMIVATGAAERAVAFPGWTLPGIMTIGAAQIMINRERIYPGKRTVVVGTSDFAFEAVKQLIQSGIEVAAIVERKDKAVSTRQELIKSVLNRGVPIHFESEILEAKGHGKVERVTITSISNENLKFEEEVDFVALDGGREPILECFTMLQCELAYQSGLGGWAPVYSHGLETNRQGIFVAGNAAGVSSQASILQTGSIAGISVAERLGKLDEQESFELKVALWDRIYQWETERDAELWNARVAQMESYAGSALARDPKQWMKVSI